MSEQGDPAPGVNEPPADPRNEPDAISAAFSEKISSTPPITVHHSPSESIESFQRPSHARPVFMVKSLPSGMGQRIRLLRAEKEWSQRVLAEKAGVGIATVERAETSRATPHPQTAHKLAVALGCTVAQLEGEEGAEHGDDRSEGDEG